MKRITIYRHQDCAKCARVARVHKFFDWLNRVDVSTEVPKTGPLRLGEIAVEDARTGQVTKGVDAVRQIARQIPAYFPFLLLLRVPAIARRAEREATGCGDGGCAAPPDQSRAEAAG